jgi:tRNA uridine 5-carboxymethylaminomethyl modification enzyme
MSPRAQIDRRAYADRMKNVLENTENITLRQCEIAALTRTEKGFCAVSTGGTDYAAKTVILATGTYLRGKIHIGSFSQRGGPDGLPPAMALSASLETMGIPLRRFKTGTPPRVHERSVDTTKTQTQHGDAEAVRFAVADLRAPKQLRPCYLTYTNADTKKIIEQNLHRSPLRSGQIEGTGPRYCPSIEDKIMRFPEKERHPLFIEPCGLTTREMYLQGVSSSLPEDVQYALLRTIPGLEHCEIMRPAYAIEYDCIDPTALSPSLEFLNIPGLFGAGQFNGSSGYEEAAAQGLVAGVNAAHRALGRPPFVLPRTSSYAGTLIDDLVHKGCQEPYRMMTSRSEVRLLLRHESADLRLAPLGYAAGLVDAPSYAAFEEKYRRIAAEKLRLHTTVMSPSAALNDLLESKGGAPLVSGARLGELLRRPGVGYDDLRPFDPQPGDLPQPWCLQIENDLKYEGYIARQTRAAAEAERLASLRLPAALDYAAVPSLRSEAREKLTKIRPAHIAAAGAISGVNPADVTALLIYLRKVAHG